MKVIYSFTVRTGLLEEMLKPLERKGLICTYGINSGNKILSIYEDIPKLPTYFEQCRPAVFSSNWRENQKQRGVAAFASKKVAHINQPLLSISALQDPALTGGSDKNTTYQLPFLFF